MEMRQIMRSAFSMSGRDEIEIAASLRLNVWLLLLQVVMYPRSTSQHRHIRFIQQSNYCYESSVILYAERTSQNCMSASPVRPSAGCLSSTSKQASATARECHSSGRSSSTLVEYTGHSLLV